MMRKKLLLGLGALATTASALSFVACSAQSQNSSQLDSKSILDQQKKLKNTFADLVMSQSSLKEFDLMKLASLEDLNKMLAKTIVLPQGMKVEIISKKMNADKSVVSLKVKLTDKKLLGPQPYILEVHVAVPHEADTNLGTNENDIPQNKPQEKPSEDQKPSEDTTPQEEDKTTERDLKLLNDVAQLINDQLNINSASKDTLIPSTIENVQAFNALLEKPLNIFRGITLKGRLFYIPNDERAASLGFAHAELELSKNESKVTKTITLSGFSSPKERQISQAIKELSALSSTSNYLPTVLEDKTVKPQITSNVESLNALVEGNPFSGIFTNGLTFSVPENGIRETNENDKIVITIVVSLEGASSQQTYLYLSGFAILSEEEKAFNNLLNKLNNISNIDNPLETIYSKKDVAPTLPKPITVNALNDLVEGNPFEELPEGFSFARSITTSEIDDQNGYVTIILTLVHGNLQDEVKIVLKGFITPSQQALIDYMDAMHLENIKLIKNNPQYQAIREINSFAELNAMLIDENKLTLEEDMEASLSDFVLDTTDGSATVNLTISKNASFSETRSLKLRGFFSDEDRQDIKDVSDYVDSLNLLQTRVIKETREAKSTRVISTLEKLNNVLREGQKITENSAISITVNDLLINEEDGSATVRMHLSKGISGQQDVALKLSGFYSSQDLLELEDLDNFISQLQPQRVRSIINSETAKDTKMVHTLEELNSLLDNENRLQNNIYDLTLKSFTLNAQDGNASAQLEVKKGNSLSLTFTILLDGFYTAQDSADKHLINDYIASLHLVNSRTIKDENDAKKTTQVVSLEKLNGILDNDQKVIPLSSINLSLSDFLLDKTLGVATVKLHLSKGNITVSDITLKLDGFYKTSDLEDLAALDRFIDQLNLQNARDIKDNRVAKNKTMVSNLIQLNNLLNTSDQISSSEVNIQLESFSFFEETGKANVVLKLTFGTSAIKKVTLKLQGFYTRQEKNNNDLRDLVKSFELEFEKPIINSEVAKNTVNVNSFEELNDLLREEFKLSVPNPNVEIKVTNFVVNGMTGKAAVSLTFKLLDATPINGVMRLNGFYNDDQKETNRLRAFTNSFSQISSTTNPLLVTITNNEIEPLLSSESLIQELNNLVDGTPFSNPPSDINLSLHSISKISENGQLIIKLDASLNNKTEQFDVVLGGFHFVSQDRKDILEIKRNFESQNELLLLDTVDKFNLPNITSLEELNALFTSNPFTLSNNVSVTVRSANSLDSENKFLVNIDLRKGTEDVNFKIAIDGFYNASQKDEALRVIEAAQAVKDASKDVKLNYVFTSDLHTLNIQNVGDLNRLLETPLNVPSNLTYEIKNVSYDNSKKEISLDLQVHSKEDVFIDSRVVKVVLKQFVYKSDFLKAISSIKNTLVMPISLKTPTSLQSVNNFDIENSIEKGTLSVTSSQLYNALSEENKLLFGSIVNRMTDSEFSIINLRKDLKESNHDSGQLSLIYNLAITNAKLNLQNELVGNQNDFLRKTIQVGKYQELTYDRDFSVHAPSSGTYTAEYAVTSLDGGATAKDYWYKATNKTTDIDYTVEFKNAPKQLGRFWMLQWTKSAYYTPPNGFDFIFTFADGTTKTLPGTASDRVTDEGTNYGLTDNRKKRYYYIVPSDYGPVTKFVVRFHRQAQPIYTSIIGLHFDEIVPS